MKDSQNTFRRTPNRTNKMPIRKLVACCLLPFASLLLPLASCPLPAFAQPGAGTPEMAAAEVRAAIQTNDVKRLAAHLAGDAGTNLSRLAEPFEKARAAHGKLTAALEAKNIDYQTFLADGLSPFDGMSFSLVEIIRSDGESVDARIIWRNGGRGREETIEIRKENNSWKVSPPYDLGKRLPKEKEIDGLVEKWNSLTGSLESVAKMVENGQAKTRNDVAVALIRTVAASEILKKSQTEDEE